jgi:DNA-binding NarL/FixJ family response regulator
VVADDHAMVRRGLALLLGAEADLRVVGEAADGEQAIALALDLRPDVVVMDVAMPVKDGAEATREIKLARPEIAVVALTGYDDPEQVARLLEAGAGGFLVKGASGAELAEAVRAVARGELVLPAEVAARALLHASGRAPTRDRPRSLLSERELEVLRAASQGLPNKEIARRLGLSVRTVHTHLGNVFAKLGVNTRTEAALLALRRRWVSLAEETASGDAAPE